MRRFILAKRRNSDPELAFYARCDRSRKIAVIPEQTASPARTEGFAPKTRKRRPSGSLIFASADGYCGLTAQELQAQAQKRLVNEFLLELNYERKVLVRLILRQDFLRAQMANRAEKRFGFINHFITVLGIKFRYVVAGV
jgi:hypothetical protein